MSNSLLLENKKFASV